MIDNPARDPAAPKLLVLRDPSGLAPDPISLPPLGAAVIDLCDGDNTHEQIRAEFQRRYRSSLSQASLIGLLQRLDDARMLESPRFKSYAAEVYASFARQETRPAMFAGKSYPADPTALLQQIEEAFARPNGPGLPPVGAHLDPAAPPLPRAIIAPHVDIARGGPAYAWAYAPLLVARELPDLIVVLGTNHNAMDPGCTLTRKHFETPLGVMQTDLELLGEVLEAAQAVAGPLPERLLHDEYQHRGEHSLEFQMLWLRYVLSRRASVGSATTASAQVPDGSDGPNQPNQTDAEAQPAQKIPTILPILCGSLHDFVIGTEKSGHDDPMRVAWPKSPYAAFVHVLRDTIARRQQRGQRVLWICAADLAHVGPRYGDKEPLSASDCDSLERRDRQTLKPVCGGDADAWFREIRRERDGRRVCGLSPIYTLLKAAASVPAAAAPAAEAGAAAAAPAEGAAAPAEGAAAPAVSVAPQPLAPGLLRCYAQVQAEAGSVVSIASVVFPAQSPQSVIR